MDMQRTEKIRSLLYEGESGKKFAAFYSLLSGYNEKVNLTRIVDEADCYRKHFFDSLTGEIYFPHNSVCVEVGSGGGFPSVPLMIARPDLQFTLIESVGKKCEFLRLAVRELGLRARVLNVRAEEAASDPAYREKFDMCCARAVARMNTLCEYCLPFVRKGGAFVAYKGSAEEELQESVSAVKILGGKTESSEKFALEGGDARTLIVVRKISATPNGYPRGRGKERKDPL